MLEKHRKLILSQLCAIFAVGAAILAYLRYDQVDTFDNTALSFAAFAVILFGLEIKLIIDWVQQKKRSA